MPTESPLYTLTARGSKASERITVWGPGADGLITITGGEMTVNAPADSARAWAVALDHFVQRAEQGFAEACETGGDVMSGEYMFDDTVREADDGTPPSVHVWCVRRPGPAGYLELQYEMWVQTADGDLHKVKTTPAQLLEFAATVLQAAAAAGRHA